MHSIMASKKSLGAQPLLPSDALYRGYNSAQLRPLYILSLFANVIIVVSVAALCGFMSSEIFDESQFPLPHWIFFASSVVFAPTMIALCKVLPDPSFSLCVGGLISTTGLLSTAFVSGHKQMVTFGILVGTGVTLSLTSTSISLAPYFVQRSKRSAMLIVVTVAIIMVSAHSAIVNLIVVLENKTFVILCPVVLITSVVPIMTKTWLERKSYSDQKNRSNSSDDPLIDDLESAKSLLDVSCDDQAASTENVDSVCHCIKQRFKSMTFHDGWLVSIISVIVWLFWGAGVDSTWYSMLLSPRTDSSWLTSISTASTSTGHNVILIQLLLSMIVLLIKILTEPKAATPSSSSLSSLLSSSTSYYPYSQPAERLVFGCNYMFLCLLGVGGLLVALCPDFTIPFHNHLLFSIGFALQFDDLSDLKAEDDTKPVSPKRDRVIYGVTLKQLDKLEPKKSSLEICCLVCHLLSLFMMSCLAMLLGLQVSNGLIYILSLPPFVYIFSTGGLVFVSTLSVVLSLAQPDTWL